jgi:glyoxylase-like metal-dependent hydrolase (beta-lactamase superfamily II)
MQLIVVPVGYLDTNCYLVFDQNKQTLIIDPGAESEKIIDAIEKNSLQPKQIVVTHAHPDHLSAVNAIKEKYKIPFLLSAVDSQMMEAFAKKWLSMQLPHPDKTLIDGEKFGIGEMQFDVIGTPGHSKGGICLYDGVNLFSGDTLFNNGVGRWDLPSGSRTELEDSIFNKLFNLPEETKVYPGHGESTTIGAELKRRGSIFE